MNWGQLIFVSTTHKKDFFCQKNIAQICQIWRKRILKLQDLGNRFEHVTKNIATCLNFSTSPKFGCGHLFWMMIPIPAASQNSQKKPGLGCAALALVSSCFHPDHDGILGGHSEPAPASAPSIGCPL